MSDLRRSNVRADASAYCLTGSTGGAFAFLGVGSSRQPQAVLVPGMSTASAGGALLIALRATGARSAALIPRSTRQPQRHSPFGPPRTGRIAERTRTRHADVRRLLGENRNYREIPAALGLSRNTVRRFARAASPEELLVNDGTGPHENGVAPPTPYSPGLTFKARHDKPTSRDSRTSSPRRRGCGPMGRRGPLNAPGRRAGRPATAPGQARPGRRQLAGRSRTDGS